MKEKSRDKTENKPAIPAEDFRKLYTSGTLGTDNPISLLNKVVDGLVFLTDRRC